jgi:hypothetical protein
MSTVRIAGGICQGLLQFIEKRVTRRRRYAIIMPKNGRDIARHEAVKGDPHRPDDLSFWTSLRNSS